MPEGARGRLRVGREEGRVRGPAQEAVELPELSALALPAHPHSLARVPHSAAMEEAEAVAAPGGGTMPRVELADRVARERDERRVLGKGLGGRVGPVRQEREPQLGIGVGQVVHFQPLDDLFDLRFVGQKHRNRDERAQLGRDAVGRARASGAAGGPEAA